MVDDEKIIRDLFTMVLGKKGYEVVTAKDGDEALKVFTKGAFNLVMMDIKLPGTDGVKLLAQLKEMDSDVEGMIITGYASLESAIEALKNGASEYITKPFDKIEDVVRVVNRLVEKQQLTLENKRLQEKTQRQRDELKQRVFELGVLYDVSDAISYTLDYKQLFRLIMTSLSKVVNYDTCASFIFTEKRGNLVVKAAKAVTKDFVEQVEKNVIEALSSLTSQTISEKDISVSLETIPPSGRGEKALTKVSSFFNIPLIVKDKAIGILNVSSSRENAFSPADIRILYTISNQAAIAIRRLRGVIAAEKSKMEAMVESMTEGLIMMDREGNPIVCNPAAKRMLNLAPEEIDRKRLEECFKKTGLDLAYEEIIFGRKEVVTNDITISEPIHAVFRSVIAPVKDINGKNLGMVIALRDITAEKEVDRMKTEFISTVSHELRTPLTTMKEFTSIISDEIPGKLTMDQREYIDIIKGNIDRLARLINSLLDISKIEARRVELRKTLIDLANLAKATVFTLKPEADKKHIEFKALFHASLSSTYVDPDRITQVFTNLIGNAIKFTPENGKITVEIIDKQKELECSVADTGVGIAPENLDRLFGRFQQIGRVAGPGAKGTGLGLAISKELIEMHNGRIWAESKLGKGSKFIFTLPKYTIESLFKEYINNGIKEAKSKDVKMSLVVVSLANFDKSKQKFSDAELDSILKDMEDVLRNNLRPQEGDALLKGVGEIAVLLADCNKENALKVEGRLEHMLEDYLTKKKLTKKIKLTFGRATYPDEAKNDEELFKKAKKGISKIYKKLTGKRKVAVVDDEEDLLKIVKSNLEQTREFQVYTYFRAAEAIEGIANIRPEVIIVDIRLPEMNGYELVGRLSEYEGCEDISVIFITAYDFDEKELGKLTSKKMVKLSKPFGIEELIDKINLVTRRES